MLILESPNVENPSYVLFSSGSRTTKPCKLKNSEALNLKTLAGMEDTPMEEGETNKDIEVAPALIAVHPAQESVAVAVGSELRVFDLQ
jgi:hypothetical protein